MLRPEPRSEHALIAAPAHLRPLIDRWVGYHHEGLEPGTHLGLPGSSLTLVLSLGAPTRVSTMPRASDAPAQFDALVGGLHTSPAVIAYEEELLGVQLDLTPRGARALLGLPAGELAGVVLSLQTLFGSRASQLIERLREAPDWDTRFHLITEMLTRQIGGLAQTPRPLEEAWQTILCSGGRVRIADLATRVGYSRRQLDVRFAREYGLAPKQLARIVRFERSRRLLVGNPRLTLAWIAASCGYYDQAHMARDWKQFAGCSPTSWLVREELPFVQDESSVGPSS